MLTSQTKRSRNVLLRLLQLHIIQLKTFLAIYGVDLISRLLINYCTFTLNIRKVNMILRTTKTTLLQEGLN